MTANYTAVKLEAGRLTVQRTIITPRGWVKRPRPDACMGKFILKLLILIVPVAGIWYYGTRAVLNFYYLGLYLYSGNLQVLKKVSEY